MIFFFFFSVLKVVFLGEYRLFKKDGRGSVVTKIVDESAKLSMDGVWPISMHA